MTKLKQLLNTFVPTQYDLSLDINHSELSFSGTVTIQGSLLSKTDSIPLHAKELTIISATINDTPATASDESEHNEILIATGSDLQPGEHTLSIEFSGKISESMVGIYASNFTHEDMAKKIIATQFESHHAREAFPCIDEPSAKSTFTLTLTTDDGIESVSNTPVVSQNSENGRMTTVFETTPKMSSYLLAFAAGEMHYVEAKTKAGTVLRSYSSVASPKQMLHYSLNEGVKVLEFFEDYFGTPYPLAKCDQIALPDFDAGAMENWGMVTYREIAMLADSENRSISSEQYVSLVVAHELSHQWFGNLVTMKWWDDLWLNESFASLMEHIALDAIHPDWQQWEHYTSMDVLSTTSRDIHTSIQPISVEVEDPELIETLFDPGIVYAKGGRLLKMLREYIGDEAFRSGLQTYFKEHAYSNASRDDLWKALGDASGQDVGALMTPWLVQPGMPVVSVDQSGSTVSLTQSRFTVDRASFDTTWPIPLLPNSPLEQDVLSESTYSTTTTSSDYVQLNQYGSGHFFTNYLQPEHKAAIATSMKDLSMSTESRINTLNDLIVMSRGGITQIADGLQMVSALSSEPRFSVWALISRMIGTAQQLTEGNETARLQLNSLRGELAKDLHSTLGFDENAGEDPNDVQLRNLAVGMMLAAEDEAVVAKVLADVAESKTAGYDSLDAESRSLYLGTAIKHGDTALAHSLVELYPSASAEMQLDIVSALSSTRDPELAKTILAQAFGENGFVRTQDIMRWLVNFMRSHYLREMTWETMIEQWDWISTSLKNSKSFDFLPVYCAGAVTDETWAQKYRDFFEPLKTDKLLAHNIAIGLGDISARVQWRTENEQPIHDWLSERTKN